MSDAQRTIYIHKVLHHDVVEISVLGSDPFPSVALIVGGLLAIFVAAYGHRDDSHIDELGTFLAFILGAIMLLMAVFVAMEESLGWFSLAVIIVLAVTLFLKPMKEIPWAALVGMAAGGAAAFFANSFLSDMNLGVDTWIVLVVIFLVVGAIVHMFFHFIEDMLTIARKVLDWGPVMIIVGLIAIVEGVLVLMDRSIITLF
jgi:hypothetical protein